MGGVLAKSEKHGTCTVDRAILSAASASVTDVASPTATQAAVNAVFNAHRMWLIATHLCNVFNDSLYRASCTC